MNDLISRRAAIQAIDDLSNCYNGYSDTYDKAYIIGVLEEVPTIDPVKYGKWIKMSDADGVYWACSECGEDIPRVAHYNPQSDLFPRLESIDKTNYCPNCGAKMVGE